MTKKKKSQSQILRERLDEIFSKYIRLRDKDIGCYTCGYNPGWKRLQNGHFVPRQYLATRYDERNCHAQCFSCNMYYGGQPATYAKLLQEQYGAGIIEELESGRWVIIKEYPYEEKIEYYKIMVDRFLEQKNDL